MMISINRKTWLCLSLAVTTVALAGCQTAGSANGTATPNANRTSAEKLDSAFDKAVEHAEASGNKQEVIAILEQVYGRNPQDPVVATRYARALREDDQLNKARMVLEPFLSGDNAYAEAATEMAMIHLNLGQYKEAELIARDSISIEPNQGRGFLALGTALDAQGYHEQAETAFRRGLQHWQGDPAPILNNLALNLASQGQLTDAISILQRAKEASPGRMEIERNLRIISTLLETSGPVAPKPGRKPEVHAAADTPEKMESVVAKPQPKPETTSNFNKSE